MKCVLAFESCLQIDRTKSQTFTCDCDSWKVTAKLQNLAQISFRGQLPKTGKGSQHSMGGGWVLGRMKRLYSPGELRFLSRVVIAP